jgi:hypothetical protein
VRGRIETTGINMVPVEHRTPDYLARLRRAEIEKWAVLIRASRPEICVHMQESC